MKHKSAAAAVLSPVNCLGSVQEERRGVNPQTDVIDLRVVVAKGTEPEGALSQSEQAELDECEGILKRGLRTFFEVGGALLTVRERRLYRQTHSSFEKYCHERWNIGRSYACRVIGAAERLRLLPGDDGVSRPTNEFQMRPFLKLATQEFPGAWKRVVNAAKEGKITTRVVQSVIQKMLPETQGHGRPGKQGKRRGSNGKLPKGEFLMLLGEAKRHVQKGETDEALAALERIEGWLFRT